MMNIEACEKAYGKMIKEDENFCYFEGKGEYGITVPKHVHWSFQPERLSETDHNAGAGKVVCDSLNTTNT